MNYLTQRLIGCGFLIGVVAVIGIGVAIYQGVVGLMHSNAAAPFRPHMAAYLAPPKDSGAPGPVKGKMIVLDRKTQDIDWDVSNDLPGDLKAAKAEEVGTVVLVDWGKELDEGYNYGDGHPAYWQTCDVTVIDHASRTVIGKNKFKGGTPPTSIDENDSEGDGPKPTKEVAEYLKGLPRN